MVSEEETEGNRDAFISVERLDHLAEVNSNADWKLKDTSGHNNSVSSFGSEELNSSVVMNNEDLIETIQSERVHNNQRRSHNAIN